MGTLLLILIIAVLVYMIAGYVWRDTPLRGLHLRGKAERLRTGDRWVRRAFEVMCASAFQPGNRIEVLENGDALFPRLFADVRAAQCLITWQVFWFKRGDLANRVADALAERAEAGVEVLLLLDYFGSLGLGDDYVNNLRDRGVRVEIYRPLHWRGLYKVPHRSHVRSVVIDGRIGYTGGFGIDDQWTGDGRTAGRWRDTHVRLEGPVVDQLQAPFISNWAECTGELLFGDGVMQADALPGEDVQEAAVMYGSPSLGSTTAERFLALTISAAHDSLFVTSAYFVPPPGFRRMLKQAASRGVDVRVLTPGGNTDQRAAWYAGRAYYEELLAAGVRIYEYTPTMVHAKTIVADGHWVTIGSVNFDNRSLKLNDEVTLVAEGPALGHAMQEMFLRDLELAEEVKLEAFRNRSKGVRAKERAAALLAGPLL